MRIDTVLVAITIALPLCACRSQEQKQQSALQAARSSVAAAAFTADAWLQGHVPDAFAQDALASAAKSLTKSPKTPLPHPASRAIQQAGDAAERARAGVARHDRVTVTHLANTLAGAQRVLDAALKHTQP